MLENKKTRISTLSFQVLCSMTSDIQRENFCIINYLKFLKWLGERLNNLKKNCDFRAITSMANSLGRAEGSASVKQPAVMELCKGF